MNSIFTGVAGMQANQQAVDVIANNIANLNTVAFKAGRVTFEETLVRTLSGGSGTGINPMQVGMGVGIGTIDTMMVQGNLRSTGRPLDMAVVGDGFFMVGDGMSRAYTRDGVFQLDRDNRLVMASNGLGVFGWQADIATGQLDTSVAPTGDIRIPIGTVYAVPTGNVVLGGNMDATTAVGDSISMAYDVYDSLGTTHRINMVVEKTAAGEWSWTATSPDMAAGATPAIGTLTFNESGHLVSSTNQVSIDLAAPNGATTPIAFTMDLSSLSQVDGETSAQAMSQDGLPMGTLQNYSIDESGVIYGSFSNGASRVLGQLALARFANPAGLSREGSNLWNVSPNSGNPVVQTASVSSNKIRSGFVEMSNVDLASEFANLIVTQRSFQANSRSITTSDEMLQEVMQIKR